MSLGTSLNPVTVAANITFNATITPRQWQTKSLAEFTLNAGATITKTITNSSGSKFYIGFISISTDGGTVKVTINPPLPSMSQTQKTGTGNLTIIFDYKEGIALENGQSIDIVLTSEDLLAQNINIYYLWAT